MHLDRYTCLSAVCLPISSRNGPETGGRDEVVALKHLDCAQATDKRTSVGPASDTTKKRTKWSGRNTHEMERSRLDEQSKTVNLTDCAQN